MYKIFPATLIDGKTKVPLIKGWREKATDDPGQIKLWQELYRDRITFYGIPMGAINGVFALDIDIKTNGFKTIEEMGLTIPLTLAQKTLNGGQHYIFKFDPNRDTGNKVGFLPGLDIRSSGGWIAYYGWYDPNVPIADAPEWLYHYANKTEVKNAELPKSTIKLAPEIAEAIFKTSIDAIINAPEGEGNNTLNIESFKVGQLISSGSFTREFAENELFKAAKQRGRGDYEARATIESGLNGGLKNPLLSPFPNQQPVPSIQIPTLQLPERWTPQYLRREDLLNTSKLRKPQLFKDWSTEDISITTADGGTGKTTLKLYEAICLALGDRFLGFECAQRGKTLFITGEDTAAKLAAMVGAILKQMELMDGNPVNEAKIECVLQSIVIKKDADLCLIAKDKQGFLYPNPQAMEKLLQAVNDIKPKMIVFDPIASFWGSESALNDMNKAVTRFMSDLVEKSGACVEMINHMGKSSSANKDMTQFAGRGGSGLPSNSRVSRVLRALPPEEYTELTGMELVADQSAMLCNVNKFSDGSPLFNKPFIIIREQYLFKRISLSIQKAREMEKQMGDLERIFTHVKKLRQENKYPTRKVIIGHFMNNGDPMSEGRIKRALDMLEFTGHMGEKLMQVDNPNLTIKDKAIIITDMDEKEIVH